MNPISRRAFVASTAGAALITAGCPAAWAAPAQHRDVHGDVLRDAAMVWRRLPSSWQTAPFFGNGFLAAHIYNKSGEGNVLRIMINHSLVQDQRGQWEAAIGYSRLGVGYLTLTFAGSITGVDWKLDLDNAELSGTVTTSQGSVAFHALILNHRSVLLVSLEPTAGERSAAWGFTPLPSYTTRTIRRPPDYTGNPDPTVGPGFVEQPLHAGGGYTTAWREVHSGSKRLLAATIVYGYPDSTGREAAIRAVNAALDGSPEQDIALHRAWWHAFYRRSLVSVPDKKLQRFYWIQLYKLACATRGNSPVTPVFGPWFPESGNGWTNIWWNTNVQVTYPVANGSNHPELDAITPTFRKYHTHLESNIRPELRDGKTYALCHPGDWQLRSGPRYVGVPGVSPNDHTGNLTWALHNAWVSYRHHMDDEALREVIHPVLTKAVNYYARHLTEGTDGKLHLPVTRSPEYANAADCTYDLSLLRWGCATLLQSAQRLRLDDPSARQWRDILARLVPYHENEQGVMIGAGVPLAESHRHFSHLLWLYPLQEKLDRRTFDHWTSMQVRWHGYSYAAASSMETLFGKPEEALHYLRFYVDGNVVDDCAMTPNTMYREGGGFALESPISAAQSLLDMLTQSHGGVVKVFPAVSRTWEDASVFRLRTQGAFLVDASRSSGRTDWIRVSSEAGEPLKLRHGIEGEIEVRNESGKPIPYQGEGTISIPLRRGQTAVISRKGTRPTLRPRDVPANGPAPSWGLPE
ncbi:glycosyl hydrolase family 95 catalytic domain-containing protein [Streptomyces sp. KR80]|uniref:glycosyl hydrolase family 95 catalytic domain-containing protein n=1 Tax=Streptomyces sp. KR80 TaxID=3457426 RepID=UPI003FCF4A63